jgi:hypothetical protein
MEQMPAYILMFLLLPLLACGQEADEDTTPPPQQDSTALAEAPFGPPQAVGTPGNELLTEVSGMAASRYYDDALWVHNDSGNDPLLFLISESGETLATFSLDGLNNRDWEDMAIGPGPETDKAYLYLADIGDNLRMHREKIIYRIPEPERALTDMDQTTQSLNEVAVLRFIYPDGRFDAETLLADPLSGDLYVISKSLDGSGIYRIPAEGFEEKDILEAEKLGELPDKPASMFELITGGDVNADGTELLIKSYQQVFYWNRTGRETPLHELLQVPPDTLNYRAEPQGEAIAFDADGEGFFTLSEERFNIVPVLYFYERRP